MTADFEEFFVLWGMVFAVLKFDSNLALVRCDQIEVAQNDLSLAAPKETWRLIASGEDVTSHQRAHYADAEISSEPCSGLARYLVCLSVPEGSSRFNPKVPCQVSITGKDGCMVQRVLTPRSITPQWLTQTDLKPALGEAFQQAGHPEVATILQSVITVGDADSFRPFYIDRAVASGSGLVLDGWIPRVGERQVSVTTGDLTALVPKSALATRSRADVHQYLLDNGMVTDGSNVHSFAAVLPADADRNEQAFYFLERTPSDGQVRIYGPIMVVLRQDENEALQVARQFFGEIQALPPSVVNQIYRPLLALPEREILAKKYHFGPPLPSGEPIASIIIPFYGDAFFLNCVFHLQRVLPRGFELILVVDDARIWPEIYSRVISRSKAFTIPTTLLQNAENYGFGRANNLGFMAASGDVVFLMNSDIIVTDPASLVEAAEVIRTRKMRDEPELIIGFSLLYEDETIQHIGMEFPQSSAVGGLHLADHPMKGLPFSLYRGESIRQTSAVTAALMALSADLYGRLGGFDPVYVRGDFEDADLCLRAEQFGAEAQVFVRLGLYHLERQSISTLGDGEVRQMITYLNCVAFNQRWQGRLSSPTQKSATPRPRFQVKKRASLRP